MRAGGESTAGALSPVTQFRRTLAGSAIEIVRLDTFLGTADNRHVPSFGGSVTREIRFGQQDAAGYGTSSFLPASEYAGEQLSLDEYADGWTLHRDDAAVGEIAQGGDGFELRSREDCWTAAIVQRPLTSWRLVLRSATDHAEVPRSPSTQPTEPQ